MLQRKNISQNFNVNDTINYNSGCHSSAFAEQIKQNFSFSKESWRKQDENSAYVIRAPFANFRAHLSGSFVLVICFETFSVETCIRSEVVKSYPAHCLVTVLEKYFSLRVSLRFILVKVPPTPAKTLRDVGGNIKLCAINSCRT